MELGNSHQLFLSFLLHRHRNSEVLQQVIKLSCCRLIVIFLYRVSNIMDNHNFKLSLHLGNSELFVHSLLLSCEEYFGNMDIEENLG